MDVWRLPAILPIVLVGTVVAVIMLVVIVVVVVVMGLQICRCAGVAGRMMRMDVCGVVRGFEMGLWG